MPYNPSKQIALLNIDGDLYQSYRDCLKFLYQKVAPGGIILLDDFSFDSTQPEAFPGSRKAVMEFLGAQEYNKIQQNPFGRFFYQKTD